MSGADLYAEPSAEAYAKHDAELDAQQAAEYDDFDAFWQAQNPVKPTRIRGLTITPPVDVPLTLVDKLDRVQGSADMDAVQEVLGDIFGQGVVEQWRTAGMGYREFQVVLAWAGAHMRGQRITFGEAHELVQAAMAELEAQGGKAPAANRKQRRAAGRGRTSSGAGGA